MRKEIMVWQWSSVPYFEGQKPDEKGRYSKLIPLAEIPKEARWEYELVQAEFIKQQMEAGDAKA